jgi:hypothetical protein
MILLDYFKILFLFLLLAAVFNGKPDLHLNQNSLYIIEIERHGHQNRVYLIIN